MLEVNSDNIDSHRRIVTLVAKELTDNPPESWWYETWSDYSIVDWICHLYEKYSKEL